ncbi:MAG TPA: ABC transporter ATP-binding protein [Microlunatus sp.]
MPLIAVHGVSHTYAAQRRPVLREVTVELTEHRIGVIGANGSGKSTFARLLNGLIVPDRGTVTVDGHDTRREGRRVRQLVGFCFTDPDAQIVMPTVAEDVAFSLRRRDLRGRALEGRVGEVLARFGLAGHADHPAQLLSGGQKQLLALASVLVTEPALVVLDEPTTLLDLRNATLIAELLAALDEQVVLLTHHLDLLVDFDRVLVFDDGRLVADAAPGPAIEHYRRLMRQAR